MVSIRCKIFVANELTRLGLEYNKIELGEVELKKDITENQIEQVKIAFECVGLKLIFNKKEIIVEKIKGIIVEMYHYLNEPSLLNFSDFLQERLQYDYNYLACIFSETVGLTIEHYIIAHKIENIKTLISYDDLNLFEISLKLKYKNSAHLSNQFKQITGQTPSFYKTVNNKKHEF